MGIYSEYAKKFWDLGYVTIPCNGKDAEVFGWSSWPKDSDSQLKKLNAYIKDKPNWNIGLPLGEINWVNCLDLDIYNPIVLKKILEKAPNFPIAKKGKKGLTGFTRHGLDNRSKNSKKFIDPETGLIHQIEFLSKGRQTVMPPSVHPETNLPYVYTTNITFENTHKENLDLPIFSQNDVIRLIEEFEKICLELGFIEEKKERRKGIKGKSGGRNLQLGNMACAMIRKGKNPTRIAEELLLFDKEKHEIPLFEDKDENIKGSNPEERAMNFVNRWIIFCSKEDGIDYNSKDLPEENKYPSKKLGFFIKQVIKEKTMYHPDYEMISKYFKDELGLVVTSGWQYLYENNHYQQFDDLLLDKTIDILTSKKPTVSQVSPHVITSFKKKIRAYCLYSSKDFESIENKINLANGILDVKTRTLIPHSKKYFFKYISDVAYDPSAKCDLWNDFLEDVFEGDKDSVQFLQQAFGYTILGGYPYLHKSFCLYGTGRNGKSVVLDVLKALVSPKNCSHVSMDMLDKQFSVVMLMDKLANITNEVPKELLSSEMFKKIVGGDDIIASYKRKDEFSFKPIARLWMATNDIPRFNESTKGVHSKIEYLIFNKVYEGDKVDYKLTKKLLKELPGILNWALDGLELLKNLDGLQKVTKSDKLKLDHKIESSSVINFIESTFVSTTETDLKDKNFTGVTISKTFDNYLAFCMTENIKNKFSQRVYSRKFKEYLIEKYGPNGVYEMKGYFRSKCIKKKSSEPEKSESDDSPSNGPVEHSLSPIH